MFSEKEKKLKSQITTKMNYIALVTPNCSLTEESATAVKTVATVVSTTDCLIRANEVIVGKSAPNNSNLYLITAS